MSNQSESVTTLPRVILDYFAAANDGRIDDAAACFAENARVHDENHDHVGHAAIREWVADTTQQFQPKTQILRTIETNGSFVATARVSGDFPGSPADLDFRFTLADEKISNLSIQ
ncbi:MAG: nuclear transport factor 2 family protein [Luteolibacter sp.]